MRQLSVDWTPQLIHCLLWFVFLQSGNSSKDYDDIVIKREHPLIWRDDRANNATGANDSINGCRNSVQGRTLLVDDEGHVCGRNKLLSNGCCDTSPENMVQYSCDTCNEVDGCCAVYEQCVSCCLNPNKVSQKKATRENIWNEFNQALFPFIFVAFNFGKGFGTSDGKTNGLICHGQRSIWTMHSEVSDRFTFGTVFTGKQTRFAFHSIFSVENSKFNDIFWFQFISSFRRTGATRKQVQESRQQILLRLHWSARITAW